MGGWPQEVTYGESALGLFLSCPWLDLASILLERAVMRVM